jgi:hypothetical protein
MFCASCRDGKNKGYVHTCLFSYEVLMVGQLLIKVYYEAISYDVHDIKKNQKQLLEGQKQLLEDQNIVIKVNRFIHRGLTLAYNLVAHTIYRRSGF